MRDRWWWRPIREGWHKTDPANFLLACFLLPLAVAAPVVLLTKWNPYVLLFAVVVFPVWALARRYL